MNSYDISVLRNTVIFAFFLIMPLVGFAQHIFPLPRNLKVSDSLLQLRYARISGFNNNNFRLQNNLLPKRFQKAFTVPTIIPMLKTGNCPSPSGRFFLEPARGNDSVQLYPNSIVKSSDGNILICGEYLKNYLPIGYYGFLMKCDDSGNVIWAKQYDDMNDPDSAVLYYYKILQLNDGSILMAGYSNNWKTHGNNLILTKVDMNGNMIWNKIYNAILSNAAGGSKGYYLVRRMEEDPYTGDIYLTGPNNDGTNITKINPLTGNVIWSDLYNPSGGYYGDVFGLDFSATEVISFGSFSINGGSIVGIYRLSKSDGDTLETRFFTVSDPLAWELSFLTHDPLSKLNNGDYALSGELLGQFTSNNGGNIPSLQSGLALFNQSLNFKKAYAFVGKFSDDNSTVPNTITMFPDGSGILAMSRFVSAYNGNSYYVQFKDGQILKQRVLHYVGEGSPDADNVTELSDGGDLLIKILGDSANNLSKIEFLKLHISDTSSTCLGQNDTSTIIQPYNFVRVTFPFDSIRHLIFEDVPQENFTIKNFSLDYLPGCQLVSYCDSLKLLGASDTICTNEPFIIHAYKNPSCHADVIFQYDSASIKSFEKIDDSTYQFIFNSAWDGYIDASVLGCSAITDSIKVTVLNNIDSLNIGKDSVLCPGEKIKLNVGEGFTSYVWQDGSTDSFFTVTVPGTYFVKATNICSKNIYSDTVVINPHPDIPFSLGPDISICNTDTAVIKAPSGFLNYSWSPDYNIVYSADTQNIKVFPVRDTVYKVQAQDTSGCIAKDSIHVIIHNAPPINLGEDTSICFGDSLVLNAGPGFVHYLWNNGDSSQEISANNPGEYVVNATSSEGCRSVDSLRIKQIFTSPLVQLGLDSVLCEGSSRTLDAGNFQKYLWSTGSNERTINITDTGRYIVMVTDTNSCRGYGGIYINTLNAPPKNFLPADTSICSFSSITLQSKGFYSEYLWSDNDIGPITTITQPGEYWLQVRDFNNCVGRDTIQVNSMACSNDFFIPNVFTPNHDGINDSFKPIIRDQIVHYAFKIYDRWGSMVFHASDPNEAWDGTYHGQQLANSAYVWVCEYQTPDSPLIYRSGTVLLIR